MKVIFDYIAEREQELDRHFSLAKILEDRVIDTTSNEQMQIEVRHINTVKSGLLIHLYNVVEAVSTRTLEHVGKVIAKEAPDSWTNAVLTEWVRAQFWSTDEKVADRALKHLTNLSKKLVSGEKVDAFVIKGATGSWNDKGIKDIAQRLDCRLIIPAQIKRAALERRYRNEKNAMEYLSLRRNDLAHGLATFEDGVSELTLDDVRGLANRVLPFLKAVTESYVLFIENRDYLKGQEVAA